MPTMTTLVDGTVPVAADFNGNFTALNGVCGASTAIAGYALGDILYASATNTLSKLPIGSAGQVLAVSAGIPAWSSAAVTYTSELTGLALSNSAGDPTNDIDIAVGAAASDDAAIASRIMLSLTSALTKQLDAAWAVGSAAGGLDGGTIANGTYHVYLIERVDTGVVDALFSRNNGNSGTITMTIASPAVVTWTDHGLAAGSSVVFSTTGALPTGVTAGTRYYVIAAGLTTDAFEISATEGGAAINTSGTQSGVHTATADPIMPTSYTKKRRIGSILREAAAIVLFKQYGDDFFRSTPVLDVDATAPGTSAVTRTLASLPIGVNMLAYVNAVIDNDTTSIVLWYLSSLDSADLAASLTAAPLGTVAAASTASSSYGAQARIWTNRQAQIRSRASASGAADKFRIATLGWFDRRGRN